MRKVTTFSFDKGGNWNAEWIKELAQITELVRIRVLTQGCQTSKGYLMSKPLHLTPASLGVTYISRLLSYFHNHFTSLLYFSRH